MVHDPHHYGPGFAGSFVILRPEGDCYTVEIDPRLPTGEGTARSFGSKHEAWGEARHLWQSLKLSFRDLTVGQTARSFDE